MKCRICGAELEKPFLSLGNLPLSNSFINEKDLYKVEQYYPLDVYVCTFCGLMQIDEFENIEDIFSSIYPYYSSYSKSWVEHSKKYVDMIIEKMSYDEKSYVVEIASNDGYLLQFFKEKNIKHLGIEPASETANVAISKGINTDIRFFSKDYAIKRFKQTDTLADLIIGNNVFAHNPKLHDFVEGLRIALKKDGIITLEFPHLLQLISNKQFDTIYHEHFSYYSLKSLIILFGYHDLEIFDVDELRTHGGSLRIYVKHRNAIIKNNDVEKSTSKISSILAKELKYGLYEMSTYIEFRNDIYKIKRDLLSLLIKLKRNNKKIIGYGAPAKGNILINFCGIGIDFIEYVVDISPHKQGMYLPGSHIPIKDLDEINKTNPDYIIILPWNLKDEIMKYLKENVLNPNTSFIIPIPKVTIL